MNACPITPIRRPLRATVRVPGSKSLTNRALLVAALAPGESRLTNVLFSDDTRWFSEALIRLGVEVRADRAAETMTVHGRAGGPSGVQSAEIYVGNAGTAARFLTAYLTLGQGEYVLDGNERMRERPIADLLDALNALGANVESVNGTGCPPVRVRAAGLPGGAATVACNVSSQYLSALLMIAPYAREAVEISIARGLNSKPYVDMTIGMMDDFGVRVEREGYERFRVTPGQYRSPGEYAIESDASAASYFFAAPAIVGGTVRVLNISRQSCQGDIGFLNVLAEMGCTVAEGDGWIEVTGPESPLRGVEVDLCDMPDTAQTLAAIAPFAATPTTIRGIASARVKETDRVAAMCAELTRLGVEVEELPDGLIVQPCRDIQPATIQTYDDHRMAMAFALVGLRAEGVSIADASCVSKTFPNYLEVLDTLRE
jgi:3-phosphoshikimate 1-carboxyvinyltransferase